MGSMNEGVVLMGKWLTQVTNTIVVMGAWVKKDWGCSGRVGGD